MRQKNGGKRTPLDHELFQKYFFCTLILLKNNISFEKNNFNKYITFSFKEWVDKHPIGVLQQTIGFTNNINNFLIIYPKYNDLFL